ncbi:MAG: ABC transporter permease, partial [Terriglobales bacterium]
MRWRSKFANFTLTLFRRNRADEDLNEEFDGFVEDLVARKVQAEGISPEQARRLALRELGGELNVKEEAREAWLGNRLYLASRDLLYAWRGFRRSRGFAIAAVLTLGLGIGASTALFALVDAMLIEQLPFRDARQLVFVWSDMSDVGYPRAPLSGPELKDLRERGTLFSGFGAIWANTAALTGEGDPEQLRIGFVTADFFKVLGADAALGRTFSVEDETKGAPRSVILSWSLWQRRFAADPHLIGGKIQLNGASINVIGIMPRDFRLLLPTDSAVPDDQQAWLLFSPAIVAGPRGQQYLRVVGRLKPGVGFAQGREQISNIAAQISREFSEYAGHARILNAVALHADDVREFRPVLLALFGGAILLLVIACINIGSLLIARAISRQREIAVRMALGASVSHLFQQCLVEGLMLTFLGAAAGGLGAFAALKLLLALRPAHLDRLAMAHISGRVVLFTVGTALVWGILLSLAPLGEVLRRNVMLAMQSGSSRVVGGRQRLRMALVVLQIALSLTLAVSAGLMQKTFLRLLQVNPGFDPTSSLSFRLALPGARYRTPEQRNAFSRQFEAKLQALPGVQSAGAVSHLPYDNLPNWGGPYRTATMPEHSAKEADYRAISPGFFAAVKVPIVEGRGFSESDQAGAPLVVVIDDLLAKRLWPATSPLGQTLLIDPGSNGTANTPATVIGVVHHLRLRSLV